MLTQNKKLVYELILPIRWIDMDAYGHVNTSVYFTYFEQARIAWFTEVTAHEFKLEETGPVVVNASCSFLKSIVYPEIITIKLYLGSPGRSSYETFYQIISAQNPDVLYAEGSAKIVWVNRTAGKAIPLPDDVRQLLA